MTPLSESSWALNLRTWLLDPAPAVSRDEVELDVAAATARRARVAVVGLAPACGTTTVARGIAAALAARDPGGAAIVSSASQAVGAAVPPLRSASRLAARLPGAAASGRLCLWASTDPAAVVVSGSALAPIVFDVPHSGPAASCASLADVTVLVVPGDAEPALAELAAHTLARHGRTPLTAVNRTVQPRRWTELAAALLPDSRMGSRLALAGWQPPGRLGHVLARLADECEAAA